MGDEKIDESKLFELLTPEEKQKLVIDIMAKQKQQDETIKKLQDEVSKKNRVIEVLSTENINIERLAPLEECAPYIGKTGEELTELLEKNPPEFIKTIFRQTETIMTQKQQAFKDAEVDLEGNLVLDKIRDSSNFFIKRNQVSQYTTKDIQEYPEKVELLRSAYNHLITWHKLDADVMALDEVVKDLTMHYAIRQMKLNAQAMVDGSQPIIQTSAPIPTTTGAPVQAETVVPESEVVPAGQLIVEKIEEQNKKIGIIEQGLLNIQKMLEEPEAEEKEAEPPKKGKK